MDLPFFRYNFLLFMSNFLFGFLFYLWPCIAVFIVRGPVQWLNIINIMLTLCVTILVAKHFRLQKRFAIFYPLGLLLLLYAICNSVAATYRHKGIIWRDTHYSLQTLRNKK